MTETIQEVVEFINSSFAIDWEAEVAHIRAAPFCECGGRKLSEIDQYHCTGGQRLEHIMWYSDTCYECGVVSSD